MNFIMTVGLPASGKSTFSETFSKRNDYKIHSSDSLRKELWGDESKQGDNNLLFQELQKRIHTDLKNNNNVIFDATNLNSKKRKSFLSQIRSIKDIYCSVYVFATSVEKCVENNSKRERFVPEHVIERMWKSFNFPLYSEGWDEIKVIKLFHEQKEIGDLFKILDNFNQENPNHNFTLGKHMREAYKIDCNYATLLHDIGKLYTKTFQKKDGTIDSIAHYYGHENVSSYEAMFYMDEAHIIDECQLIQLHMLPYYCSEETLRKKAGKLYDRLVHLNKADREGH